MTGIVESGDLIGKLVVANRILYKKGVLDEFGQVTARDDADQNCFLLARSMAPGLVGRGDVRKFSADGNRIDSGDGSIPLERFIHSAIYRVRSDVYAIVHCHAVPLIALGVSDCVLKPVCHMGGFIGRAAPVFDIREVAGDTDMLVRNAQLGDALAVILKRHSVLLMRGHGAVIVGESLQQVVFRAIYAVMNAVVQLEATKIGEITYLSEQEAMLAAEVNNTQIDRCWQLWQREV